MSLNLRGEYFGKSSPAYINSLHNIGVLQKDLGEYDRAEHIFNYLDRVIPQLFTENSFHYTIMLNNKAMLFASLGRGDEALELIDKA